MRSYSAASMSLVVWFMLVVSSFCLAGEKKISRKEVPSAVLSAFEKTYPKASMKGFSKEVEDGKTFYEIESLEGTTTRDVLYFADGKVSEIEEGVPSDKLPEVIKATVNKEYPKGKIVKAEHVTRGSVVNYEIHIASGKATFELVLGPDGTIVKQKKAGEEKEEGEESEEKD